MDILLWSILLLVDMILACCVMFFGFAFRKHYNRLKEYDLICWKNLSRYPSFWGFLISTLLSIIAGVLLFVFF